MHSNNGNFHERCYALLKQIPAGKVTTYGEIARALHSRAYRAVGTAMANNRQLFAIPCHRVVRSNGAIGEYALGPGKKAELLTKEGVTVKNGRVEQLDAVMHRFPALPESTGGKRYP
jgi:methylated-DNA-[protein]-cysteine S-methyltransferase